MKNFLQVILMVFFFVGCTQRIGDFTAISTKNIDLDANYVMVERSVKGKDMKPIIIVINLGYPNLEEAIDDALNKVEGGVMMTDATLKYRWFYIPYIYGEFAYEVQGDVWKKVTDTSSIITGDEEIYTAVEHNGELTLVKKN